MAVIGSDEGRVKQEARELAVRMTPPDAGDFGCEIIDGMTDNADQAASKIHETLNSLETLPFFGEKLVWLKSANFLGDTPAGRSATVLEALEALGELLGRGIDSRVRFLLSATPIDKRRAFIKTLDKTTDLLVFDALSVNTRGWEQQAEAMIAERAREHGLKFTPDALEYFLTCTGADTRLITSELEKLSLAPDSEKGVTIELVRLFVARTQAGVIFDLGNAFAERDLPRALSLVDQLLFHGETPIGILLAAIIPTVRNLMAVRTLMDHHGLRSVDYPGAFASAAGRLSPEAVELLPRKKDGTVNYYGIGFAAVHAKRFKMAEMRRAMDACLEANVRLVSSSIDPKSVLDHTLVRCLA